MKYSITVIALLLGISMSAYSQDAEETTAQSDTTYWTNSLKFGLNFNQATFSDNWKAGGVNSIAFGGYALASFNYEKDKISWNNEVDLQYGIVKNEGQGLRKNIDRILIDSKVGYKMNEKWQFYGSVNFLTQFAKGYEYSTDAAGEEQRSILSDFMNPAFATFSLGFEYKPVDYFWVRLSPLAPRFTFVTDTTIYRNVPSNYGVEIGEKVRQEWLAANIIANFDKDVAENLNLKASYTLYANYEELAFNTIDHRLDFVLTAKVNKLIDVNLRAIALYDKDQDDDIQFSQSLALGIAYKISNR